MRHILIINQAFYHLWCFKALTDFYPNDKWWLNTLKCVKSRLLLFVWCCVEGSPAEDWLSLPKLLPSCTLFFFSKRKLSNLALLSEIFFSKRRKIYAHIYQCQQHKDSSKIFLLKILIDKFKSIKKISKIQSDLCESKNIIKALTSVRQIHNP